jgi:hypothetical protein
MPIEKLIQEALTLTDVQKLQLVQEVLGSVETNTEQVSHWQQRMEHLMQEIATHHPFANHSQAEILQRLRQTREEAYEELYGETNAD